MTRTPAIDINLSNPYGLYRTAWEFKKPRRRLRSPEELFALSVEKQVDHVVSIRVPHAKFASMTEACEAKFRLSGKVDRLDGLFIVGPSRCGKTTLAAEFAARYPPRISRTRDNVIPVLIVTTPPYPTAMSLMEQFLYALGDPHWYRGSRQRKRNRLVDLLLKCRVEIVFLDEIQHLVDMTGDLTEAHATIFLQQLVQEVNIAFVFLGLERAVDIFRGSSPLRNRFESPLYFSQYDWKNEEDRKNWMDYLKSFTSLLPFREMPPFDSNERLAKKMWYAAFGLSGLNAKLLTKCTEIVAVKADQNGVLTMDILSEAFRRTAWEEVTNLENPFLANSKVEDGPLPPIVEEYNPRLVKASEMKTMRAQMAALTNALIKRAA